LVDFILAVLLFSSIDIIFLFNDFMNFIFFDIYDKYLDNEGFLSKDKSIDDVHILNGIFIEEFIRKI